jgi:hypothetical protein
MLAIAVVAPETRFPNPSLSELVMLFNVLLLSANKLGVAGGVNAGIEFKLGVGSAVVRPVLAADIKSVNAGGVAALIALVNEEGKVKPLGILIPAPGKVRPLVKLLILGILGGVTAPNTPETLGIELVTLDKLLVAVEVIELNESGI